MFNDLISTDNSHTFTPDLHKRNLLDTDGIPLFSGIMESVYDYVSVYDRNMTLISCSKSCLEILNRGNDKNFYLGKHFNVLAPDFKKRDLYNDYKIANDRHGFFELDNFPLNNPSVYDDTHYVRFKLFDYDSFMICAAEDITVNVQYQVLKQKYLNLLARNKQLEALLLSKYENSREANNFTRFRSVANNLATLQLDKRNFTEREIEIMQLIAEGKTTRDIAEYLFLSVKTIDFHRVNIRKKLNLTHSKKTILDVLSNLATQEIL